MGRPDPDTAPAALAGRPLVAPGHRTRGQCRRCRHKNHLRRSLGVTERTRTPTFDDGDRVTLTAVPSDDAPGDDPADTGGRPLVGPTTPRERRWVVTRVDHADHTQRSLAAVADPDALVVRLAATVRTAGWRYRVTDGDTVRWEDDPDALVLSDCRLVAAVPVGTGTDTPGHAADPDPPGPLAPRPEWPAEERAWRRRLVREHGPPDPGGEFRDHE